MLVNFKNEKTTANKVAFLLELNLNGFIFIEREFNIFKNRFFSNEFKFLWFSHESMQYCIYKKSEKIKFLFNKELKIFKIKGRKKFLDLILEN